jgi:hypothetical protein
MMKSLAILLATSWCVLPAPSARASTTASSIAVYAGYYDTHHAGEPEPKPSPWRGSSSVVFVGNSDPDGGWDTAAVRILNLTGSPIENVRVAVDIGSFHYTLWGTRRIPPHYSLILAQTAFGNFDGSDTNPAGCPTCSPSDCVSRVSKTVPVIRVTIGSTTTNYYDTHQVMNTNGVDAAGCPFGTTRNDESRNWSVITSSRSVAGGGGGGGGGGDGDPPPSFVGAASGLSLSHFPNPTRGGLTIRFAVPAGGIVRLAIYDVTGRMVRTVIDGDMDAGDYFAQTDLSREPPGLYFTRVETPAGVREERVLVVR